MANKPKKTQDPAQAALSAVQEALEIGDQKAVTEEHRPPAGSEREIPPEVRRYAPRGAALREKSHNGSGTEVTAEKPRQNTTPEDEELFAEAARLAGGEEAPFLRRPAANDDRQSVGQILQALQRRPSRSSYTVASIFSAAWLVAGIGLAWIYLPALQTLGAEGRGSVPALLGLGALYLLPVFFSYGLAHMVRRSQELRLIAQAMAEVAIRLGEPETVARESIVSVGQAIRREVAAMGDGVERALARAAELESLVHNEVSALERAYNDNEVRVRGLLHDLASQRDTLVSQAEQVRNAISSVHLDLTQDIGAVSDLVAERVSETAQRITHSLADKGEHITLALGRAGDSMINALTERGGDLLERLEHTSHQTTHAIASATERMTATLNFKTTHIQEEFEGLATNLKRSVSSQLSDAALEFEQRSENVLNMMGTRSQQMANSIIDSSTRIAESITSRVEEVNSTLKTTGDSLVLDLSLRGGDIVANLEQAGGRITEALLSNSGRVSESFRENSEKLAHIVDAKGEAVKNMLAVRLLAFEEMFTHGGAELGEKISRESTTLGNLITRNLSEFDRTVKTYGGELVERLGKRTEEVAEAMRSYVDGFDTRVNGRAEDLAAVLDRRLVSFEETLDARKQNLEQSLESRISEIAAAIDSRGANVANTLVSKIDQIDRTLGTRALEVAGDLDKKIGRIEELNTSIISHTGDAERVLTELSSNISNTLKQNAEDVERTLLGVGSEVARTFIGKADEIAGAVSARAAEMTSVLDQSSSGLLSALTTRSEDFAAQVGRATEHALSEIENKGYAFTQTLTAQSADITRGINEAGVSATAAVTRTLKELQEATHTAIEESKQTASATVSEMLETHGMLRSDTTTLFERLREANILLQEVLSGAHENMSSLENTLVTRVSEFVSSMNAINEQSGVASSKVEEQIGKFGSLTARALGDLSQLAAQFQAHGRGLAEAVELIDRSNQRTDETLGERRASLDSLVATLDNRTQEIEQRLKRFTGLLDETLDSAAGRAREIARVVSDASSGGAQAISEQFDRVRMTAEEERQRTAETMRGIYEDARTDTSALFRQSTERFTEVIQGMKHMAAEIQRELETTRAELRRGILELPQETAESAAQMRRVIVDQIEALAELNRIVARHGRGIEAAESAPARRAATNAVRDRDEGMLAGSGERMEAPRQTRRELPSLNTGGSAAPRRPEAPALSPEGGNSRPSGWLTDLLQRASREDGAPEDGLREPGSRELSSDQRTAAHSIESLDSLSVDIARMIDHNAATELWDKYKRGERNVFTRRLYTLQGQKAFDDIAKKYRADREFRQTVDRYIAEFERLLGEVSRDDRGQVIARTYLTSETGKVYTMLAHAAGRFG